MQARDRETGTDRAPAAEAADERPGAPQASVRVGWQKQTGWRARVRSTPGGALLLKAGALVLGGAFIALDSFERIEAEPAPRLVETEVPRTMLAALGLPATPENAGDAVRAEMLVGAGGEPLALRLSSLSFN